MAGRPFFEGDQSMSSHHPATERPEAFGDSEHSSSRLRDIARAMRKARGGEQSDLNDPLGQQRQATRAAALMCRLYGADAPAQARRIAQHFDNGTFAQRVMAAVEFMSRSGASGTDAESQNLLSVSFPAEPTLVPRA